MVNSFMKKGGLLFALLFITSNAFAAESNNKVSTASSKDYLNYVESLTGKADSKSSSNKKKKEVVNSWKPYWILNRDIEPSFSYNFNMNVGCGFLYFSQVRGDIQVPAGVTSTVSLTPRPDQKFQGRLSYNRTPVFTGNMGVDFLNFLNVSITYMHQGGINIQSQPQFYGDFSVNIPPVITARPMYVLRSDLALDAILASVYFRLPASVLWKTIAYNPFLGAGVGPGWQTWSDFTVLGNVRASTDILDNVIDYPFKQKISANAVWFIDAGWKLRSVIPDLNFSVNFGVKFIGWGQAKNVGKQGQNDAFNNFFFLNTNRAGLLEPFRIKFMYSFTPYMGVQWNF